MSASEKRGRTERRGACGGSSRRDAEATARKGGRFFLVVVTFFLLVVTFFLLVFSFFLLVVIFFLLVFSFFLFVFSFFLLVVSFSLLFIPNSSRGEVVVWP